MLNAGGLVDGDAVFVGNLALESHVLLCLLGGAGFAGLAVFLRLIVDLDWLVDFIDDLVINTI